MRQIILATWLFGAASANSQTLTASCKDPDGRALGVMGQIGGNKSIDGPDTMKGGVITFTWKLGQKSATFVVNTGVADSVSSVEGVLAFRTEEQLTFFAPFPGSAYMFSYFITPRRLLVSAHQQFLGSMPGSAVAKTYQADCVASLQ